MRNSSKSLVKILIEIRSDIHQIADESVLGELDFVIERLQADELYGKSEKGSEVILLVLGKLIQNLPYYIELLDKLCKILDD